MAITRRQFLKYAAASAATLGLSELELFKLTEKVMATDPATKPNVIALQGQACSGDITALLNLLNSIPPTALGAGWTHTLRDAYPLGPVSSVDSALSGCGGATTSIDDALIDIIDLTFQPTAAAPAGALGWNEGVINTASSGSFILLVEGSVPTAGLHNGNAVVGTDACNIGAASGDGDNPSASASVSLQSALQTLCGTDAGQHGANCAAVVAWGTCAAYGGIPAANNGNETTRQGASSVLKFRSSGAQSVGTVVGAINPGLTVVNVPGCPTRPDDLFLTVAQAILGLGGAELTADNRPKSVLGINLFGQTLHYHCSRKQAYANGHYAWSYSDTDGKCLAVLGCKGQTTKSSCQSGGKHQWNATSIHDTWPGAPGQTGLGTVTNDSGSSCTKVGHPCIGCKERGFPDRFSPLVKYNN